MSAKYCKFCDTDHPLNADYWYDFKRTLTCVAKKRARYAAKREEMNSRSLEYYYKNREACLTRVRVYSQTRGKRIREKARGDYRSARAKEMWGWRRADPKKYKEFRHKKYWKLRSDADSIATTRRVARQQKALAARRAEKGTPRETERLKQAQAKWSKRYREDIQFRLRFRLRVRLLRALKGQKKSQSTVGLIGCSIAQLQAHLESLWQPGMSWANHAHDGWHIDHIVPLSSFDLSDPEQQKAAMNYTNLQPLWALDNISKGGINRLSWKRANMESPLGAPRAKKGTLKGT